MQSPMTLEQAQATRYNVWASGSIGVRYEPGYCAYEVWRTGIGSQCQYKAKAGLGCLYCLRHGKIVESDMAMLFQGKQRP